MWELLLSLIFVTSILALLSAEKENEKKRTGNNQTLDKFINK